MNKRRSNVRVCLNLDVMEERISPSGGGSHSVIGQSPPVSHKQSVGVFVASLTP